MKLSSLFIAMLLLMACHSTRHLPKTATHSDTTKFKQAVTGSIDTNIIEQSLDFGIETPLIDDRGIQNWDGGGSITMGEGATPPPISWAKYFNLKDTTVCDKDACMTVGIKAGILHAHVNKPADTIPVHANVPVQAPGLLVTKTITTTVTSWKDTIIASIITLILTAITTYIANRKKPDDTSKPV